MAIVDRPRRTFTNIVAFSPNGTLNSRKMLSENPELYLDATVGNNALLEHKVEPVALVSNS